MKNNTQIFWAYVKNVHSSCPGYINGDCSKAAHDAVFLDYAETMRCVDNSFKRGDMNDPHAENTVLETERQYWNQYGAHFYPSIVINNRTYRGVFEPESVFNSLCAGLQSQPKICRKYDQFTQSVHRGINGITIVYIVLGLIVLNIVLIFCYRRISQREMKEDMRMHVNSAVSQYFALSQRDKESQ